MADIYVTCPDCGDTINTPFKNADKSFIKDVVIKCAGCDQKLLAREGKLYKLAKIISFPVGGKNTR